MIPLPWALDTNFVDPGAAPSEGSDSRPRRHGSVPVSPSEPHRTTGARRTASMAASCCSLLISRWVQLVHRCCVTNRECADRFVWVRSHGGGGLRSGPWPALARLPRSPLGRPCHASPFARHADRSAARAAARGFRRHKRPAPRWRGSPPFIPRSPCCNARWRRSRCCTATDECGAGTSSTTWLSPRDQQPRTAPSELRAWAGRQA